MKSAVKTLLKSKKTWITITAILVWVLGRFQLEISSEDLLPLVGALVTLVLTIGFQDHGKEAAKLKAKEE